MELGIFMREHFNGMYRTDTYYLTRQMAEIPVQVLTSIIFTSIFYWMVGMNPDISRFLITCLINILLVQVIIKTKVVNCVIKRTPMKKFMIFRVYINALKYFDPRL